MCEVEEEHLMRDIYAVMREHFGDGGAATQVAEDFSKEELKRFIGVYYDYLCK